MAILIINFQIYSQDDSLVCIFPLEAGFQWKYDYDAESWALEPFFETHDSGKIYIIILSKDVQTNITIWNIEEKQDFIRHYHAYSPTHDTTYRVLKIINYFLTENHDSNYIVSGYSDSKIWTFVGLHRYRIVDSSGTYKDTITSYGTITKFTFKKNTGVISRSYSSHNAYALQVDQNVFLESYILGLNDNEFNSAIIGFILFQNHPNPFNPSTKIKYSISSNVKGETKNVVLKVYDILGNEIETLVNEEKPPGTYEVTWNAANLPSGVYFYQLRTGNFLETKKMILLR